SPPCQHWSLPVLGAWIEMTTNHRACMQGNCRSLYWERGLKCGIRIWINTLMMGRSLYWERGLKCYKLRPPAIDISKSLHVLGAWIEISSDNAINLSLSRSLYWERGLKCCNDHTFHCHIGSLPVLGAWIEIRKPIKTTPIQFVAPCIGSVD